MTEPCKRRRRLWSVKNELLRKSNEAALASVQIFNSPTLLFKAEIYVVLMQIAWTYLLHAYYRKMGVEYRYFKHIGKKRVFVSTPHGTHKCWDLAHCLDCASSPIDNDTANNLRFLIGLRNEIEHQMTTRIDDYVSARFQACCLNYNDYARRLFGENFAIDRYLSFSLQFASLSEEKVEQLKKTQLPRHILKYIEGFDNNLSESEHSCPKFAYRVFFVAKTANHKGQADQVIEFVKADSDVGKEMNKNYVVLKDVEKPKYLPGAIVEEMQLSGFPRFKMQHHTELWRAQDARKTGSGYGAQLDKWYWYDSWRKVVKQHCEENRTKYE
jgi:hypothetical protein